MARSGILIFIDKPSLHKHVLAKANKSVIVVNGSDLSGNVETMAGIAG
jgi:hypothetical protein